MFDNKRFITRGIQCKIPLGLQIIIWQLVDSLKIEKDYLQIFELDERNGMQRLIHKQEQPPYKREYLFNLGIPAIHVKIYIIDSDEYSTMLLSSEY